MSSRINSLNALCILIGGLGLVPDTAFAKSFLEKGDLVYFQSGDGVELTGRYFPGKDGVKSPTVLILDDVGQGSQPEFCNELAGQIASKGCAVLTLDFRGHRRSTSVGSEFWDQPANREMVKGYSNVLPAESISKEDFASGYLPFLVNDIAAARAFLARRHHARECNVGQLFVIGIGRGATIGQLWVAAEWSRFRILGTSRKLAPIPEGRDVAGCIWINPALSLDRQKVPMLELIKKTETSKSVLVGVLHDAQNESVANFCVQCEEALKPKRGRKLFFAQPLKIDGDGSLLSVKSVLSEVLVTLESMRKLQELPLWEDRDFFDRAYVWSLPEIGTVRAKDEGKNRFQIVPVKSLLVNQ